MPYIIRRVKDGFKVCSNSEIKRCFSKKGMTLKKAKRQRTAIILAELRREGKIPPRKMKN